MTGHNKTLRIAFTLLLGLLLMGQDDCGPDEFAGSQPDDIGSGNGPGGDDGAGNSGSFGGECAPVAYLTCGQLVEGDTGDFNSGATDVIDGYPVAVGNYAGPEIAYAFEATTTETAIARFIDPTPTVLNHDIFVLEANGNACSAENAVERGFNEVSFETVAGRTYFLVIDGATEAEGAFELELECTGGGPAGPIDGGGGDSPIDASVVMSPLPYGESHLQQTIDALNDAQETIDFAMYSFRDGGVKGALEAAVTRGVTLRALLESAHQDRNDPEGSLSQWLEDMGVEVRWVNKIMHHKFAIIDGPRADLSRAETGTLITGSANWSYSAGTRYDENTLFVTGDDHLNLAFQREFNHLWQHGRPFPGGENIGPLEQIDIAEMSLPVDHGATTAMTSPNFTTSTTSYGPTFSTVSGSGAIREPLSDFILSAQDSIWVASGHLRSRQITDALLQAQQANPSLDIQVYLDGQEYTSVGYRDEEEQEYEDCLAEANTSVQVNRCEDRGVHFGLNLHEAGIPIRYKYYSYRWHYSYAVQQHHKYIIVDGERVASGSYNFSNNAERDTFENIIFFEGPAYEGVIEDFVANFGAIWDTGASGYYDQLMSQITETEDDFPIVFDSMALTWPEITDLKAAILANCADINSEDYRTRPQSHQTCERN